MINLNTYSTKFCDISCLIQESFYHFLEFHDMKMREYEVLKELKLHDNISQKQLGTLLNIDRTTMVTIIDNMEEKNLVQRVKNDKDRRSYNLQITDKALDFLLLAEQKDLDSIILYSLDEKEVLFLRETLEKVYTSLHKNIPSLKEV